MKLAFCFLIREKINKEHIWHNFFKDSQLDYRILIHSKNKPNLDYLHTYSSVYENIIPNEWGRILGVQNFFLEQSLALNADKTIFLSDSCVPIKTINYVFEHLNHDKHHIKYMKPWWNLRHRNPKNILFDYLMGQSNWCVIDKKHYKLFLDDSDRSYFENTFFIGDEAYYSTILNKYNLLNNNNVNNRYITYVDWNRRSKCKSHPYYFTNLNEFDINIINSIIIDPNLLFLRKIHENCEIENLISKAIG